MLTVVIYALQYECICNCWPKWLFGITYVLVAHSDMDFKNMWLLPLTQYWLWWIDSSEIVVEFAINQWNLKWCWCHVTVDLNEFDLFWRCPNWLDSGCWPSFSLWSSSFSCSMKLFSFSLWRGVFTSFLPYSYSHRFVIKYCFNCHI